MFLNQPLIKKATPILFTLALFSCEKVQELNSNADLYDHSQDNGQFGIYQVDTEKVQKYIENDATQFYIDNLKHTDSFTLTLVNLGDAPVSNIEITTDTHMFSISPNVIERIEPFKDTGDSIDLTLKVFHGGMFIDGNYTNYYKVLKKGLNTATFNITGYTIDNNAVTFPKETLVTHAYALLADTEFKMTNIVSRNETIEILTCENTGNVDLNVSYTGYVKGHTAEDGSIELGPDESGYYYLVPFKFETFLPVGEIFTFPEKFYNIKLHTGGVAFDLSKRGYYADRYSDEGYDEHNNLFIIDTIGTSGSIKPW